MCDYSVIPGFYSFFSPLSFSIPLFYSSSFFSPSFQKPPDPPFFYLNFPFVPLFLCPLNLGEHLITFNRQLVSIPNHLKEALTYFEKTGLSILCRHHQKNKLYPSNPFKYFNLQPPPTCSLFNFSFERCDRAAPQCLKEISFFFSCVKSIPLSYISASVRDCPLPLPPPKISESQCLSLLAIKQQIPAF